MMTFSGSKINIILVLIGVCSSLINQAEMLPTSVQGQSSYALLGRQPLGEDLDLGQGKYPVEFWATCLML